MARTSRGRKTPSHSVRPVSGGKQPRNVSSFSSTSSSQEPAATPVVHRRLPMPVTPTAGLQTPSTSRTTTTSTSSPPLPAMTNRSSSPNENQQDADVDDVPANGNVADELRDFMAEQRAFNGHMINLLSDQDVSSVKRRKKGRLPVDLTSNVRVTFKNLYGSELTAGWDLNKSFSCPENEAINVQVTVAVQNTSKVSSSLIRDALKVYFKTRKRQFKMVKENKKEVYLKQQRERSRINTKRLMRTKALENTTAFSEDQKKKIAEIITNEFMSSEESGSEPDRVSGSESDSDAPSRPNILLVKKLAWRSQEASNVFQKLDRRVTRKRTRKGLSMVIERRESTAASNRAPPDDAPQWALIV